MSDYSCTLSNYSCTRVNNNTCGVWGECLAEGGRLGLSVMAWSRGGLRDATIPYPAKSPNPGLVISLDFASTSTRLLEG